MSPERRARRAFRLREISRGAIRRWRIVLVACFGLVVLALMAWKRIPHLEDPRVDPPDATLVVPYPGASPEDVEAQVLNVLEPALFAMDGVQSLESSALPNAASVHLHFADGTPMDVYTGEDPRRRRVEAARPARGGRGPDRRSPSGPPLPSPRWSSRSPGTAPDRVLGDAARTLKDALLAVPGVASVDLRGDRHRAILVRLDPVKLAAHGVTVPQLVEALKRANVRVPAGDLRVGSLSVQLHVDHELCRRRPDGPPRAIGHDACT